MSSVITKLIPLINSPDRLFEFRKIMSNRETCSQLVPYDYPVEILKDQKTSDYRLLEGKFVTPFEKYLPGIVPEESKDAHFQIMLPTKWKDPTYKPMCIQLAGTGDHVRNCVANFSIFHLMLASFAQYFWKRRNLVAKPLMKEGNIGSIILENPFYGSRKPAHQK